MNHQNEPFGSQLYAELKRINRLDLITHKLYYDAIQRLKQSDRQQTARLFQGSSYDFLQLIKTCEPAEIASRLVQQEQQQAAAAAVIMMNMATIGS